MSNENRNEVLVNDKGLILEVKSTKYMPGYATVGSAGLDIHIQLDEDLIAQPGEAVSLDTDLQMAIPEGHFGLVAVRSGLGFKHQITLVNSVGIIDSDYRGTIGVKLYNGGDKAYTFKDGDRVAQIIFIPYARFPMNVVDELDTTERGTGGFHSTGRGLLNK